MKTTLDAVDIVWQKINSSALKTEITGGIYRKRPLGSDKEDIVINCPVIDNKQLQQGLVNVNIHVPNKAVTTGGNVDNSQPDSERLRELAVMAWDILKDIYGKDFNYDVQQQLGPVLDKEASDHFVNFRIDFFSINISN